MSSGFPIKPIVVVLLVAILAAVGTMAWMMWQDRRLAEADRATYAKCLNDRRLKDLMRQLNPGRTEPYDPECAPFGL